MTRYLICLCTLAAPVCAQELTAQQVLDKVAATYSKLSAVHMVVEREETSHPGGRSITAYAECELAAKPGHRYYARLKQPTQQAWEVSDGNDIWRALDSRRQWSKVSGASVAEASGEDSDHDNDAQSASRDMHGYLENIMLYRLLGLAKNAQQPSIAKQQDFKLGREKVPCYVIRARTRVTEVELWVDRQRFIVLQYKEKAVAGEGTIEIAMKVKQVELDQEVADSLFHFEPQRGWAEVETLMLPGENFVALTGAPAVDFTLKTLDGESVALRNLRGSVVVLDFWATWCGPCRVELPSIEKLRAEFGNAVRFYGVNDEAPGTVRKFVEEHGYEMPTLTDGNRQIHRRYGIHAIPALFVIDRDSVVRSQFLGTRSESELRKAIRAALGPADGPS